MIGEPGAFARRTLSILGLVLNLIGLTWRLPRILAVHLSSKRLRPPWREALWLAVTEVNGCRFCTYVHEGMAGAAGLSADDIEMLLAAGDTTKVAGLDPPETLAIAYAKAWAETDGVVPAGLAEQLGTELEAAQVADLHTLLYVINFANRAGNTPDSLLHRLRNPSQLLRPWATLNDLVVGLLVALFGWPAMVAGAIQRRRNRRRRQT